MTAPPTNPSPRLGTADVVVAGVALVVASSTLVSEFTGYFQLGVAFVVALAASFLINLLLGWSAADLSVAYPRAGGLYDYARSVIPGQHGRTIGTFLGLAFCGMFVFAAAGETASGAYSLRALTGTDLPVELFIVACSLLAVVPNLLGIRTVAWVSAALLLMMLGIRWFFGLAGLFGWGQTGAWALANLHTDHPVQWFGPDGVMGSAMALGIWSFVGIEFACSLAGDVKNPRRAMPRGLVLGLIAIFATSVVMGLGVAGSMPLTYWQQAAASDLAAAGQAPQLAVGQAMFGRAGYHLMALGSVMATLGTLTVAYTTIPRVLWRLAQDTRLTEPFSTYLAKTHERTGVPVRATLVVLGVNLVPALFSASVVDWVYAAAYAWLILYMAFHVLVIVRHTLTTAPDRPAPLPMSRPAAVLGLIATAAGLAWSFQGTHATYGTRALIVLGAAALAAALSAKRTTRRSTPPPLPTTPGHPGHLVPVPVTDQAPDSPPAL